MQDNFNNWHGGANVSGHNVESLKVKQKGSAWIQSTLPKLGFVFAGKLLLMTFYHVVYIVAKSKKPHTIAEELLKPWVLQMTKIVLGKEASKKLELVPLSNNVIQSQISDLSLDILDLVIYDIPHGLKFVLFFGILPSKICVVF